MACENELQNLAAAQAMLDSLTDQYDDLVLMIAGVTGQVIGAEMALHICQQSQGGGMMAPSGDDQMKEAKAAYFERLTKMESIRAQMQHCIKAVREFLKEV